MVDVQVYSLKCLTVAWEIPKAKAKAKAKANGEMDGSMMMWMVGRLELVPSLGRCGRAGSMPHWLGLGLSGGAGQFNVPLQHTCISPILVTFVFHTELDSAVCS
jgi:hypothetical protein